jgi:hypothetical protein
LQNSRIRGGAERGTGGLLHELCHGFGGERTVVREGDLGITGPEKLQGGVGGDVEERGKRVPICTYVQPRDLYIGMRLEGVGHFFVPQFKLIAPNLPVLVEEEENVGEGVHHEGVKVPRVHFQKHGRGDLGSPDMDSGGSAQVLQERPQALFPAVSARHKLVGTVDLQIGIASKVKLFRKFELRLCIQSRERDGCRMVSMQVRDVLVLGPKFRAERTAWMVDKYNDKRRAPYEVAKIDGVQGQQWVRLVSPVHGGILQGSNANVKNGGDDDEKCYQATERVQSATGRANGRMEGKKED